MERVEIIKRVVGILHMQVCAAQDATDEEILEKCAENVAGTRYGWSQVVRTDENTNTAPKTCGLYPDRLHFLVSC